MKVVVLTYRIGVAGYDKELNISILCFFILNRCHARIFFESRIKSRFSIETYLKPNCFNIVSRKNVSKKPCEAPAIHNKSVKCVFISLVQSSPNIKSIFSTKKHLFW